VSVSTATVGAGSNTAPSITTTGDTNTGIFFPAADTIAFSEGGVEAARFDSAGNFGLGVTPSAWRSTYKASQVGNATAVVGRTDNNNNYFSSNWYVNSSNQDIYQNTGFATIYTQGAGTHAWYTAASGTAGNTISFTQALTLDASGNLGIGTTSPAARLDVTNGASPSSRLRVGVGAGAANTLYSTLAAGDYVNFETNGAERARIDSSGNLLVGTTSNPVYGSTTAKLNILKGSGQYVINSTVSATPAEGHIAFRNPNGIVGEIITNGTATSYGVGTSDYRAKENVTNYTGGLNAITSLRPVSFTWKASQEQDVGFIAHEIQAVIPSTVHGEKDAVDEDGKPKMQTIFPAPPQMIANLVAAIQEQQALIQSLTTRITALESK
jgi:hypothetical protein